MELSAFAYAFRPLATDFASTLSYYLVLAATGSLAIAVVAGVAFGNAQLAWMLARRRRVAAMQWAMLLLVGLVGGAALLLHDPRLPFFKAGIAYLVVGAAMLQPGWIERYVPPIAIGRVPPRLVTGSGYVWAGLILATGLLALALPLTVPARTAALVMGVWAPTSKLMLAVGQYLVFRTIVRRRLLAEGTSPPA